MRQQLRFLLGGFGAATAMLSLFVALEMSVATARPSDPTVSTKSTMSPPSTVNRSLKGDRQPVPTATGVRPADMPRPVEQRRIGCGTDRPFSPEVAGRCVT